MRRDKFMSQTEAGRVFQTRGPAVLKDRSPIAVSDLGTSSRVMLAERMLVRCCPAYCRSLDRHTGGWPCRHIVLTIAG